VILSCVLLRAELTLPEVVDVVGPPDFYSDANRWILEAALSLDADEKAIDTVAVRGWLADHNRLERVGGATYLVQLCDLTPASVNVEEHARRVRDLARKRRAIATFQQLAAEGYGDTGDAEEWLQDCEARVFAATFCGDDASTAADYTDLLGDEFAGLEEAAQSDQPVVRATPTGFRLDEITAGMRDGEYWIIAGRPGMGKTALAEQICHGCGRNGSLAIFLSGEMQRPELARRAICQETGINLRNLTKARLTDEDWASARDAVAQLRTLPIRVDDNPKITPARVRSRIRRHLAAMRRKHGRVPLGCVVVDYLQLMRGDGSFPNRFEEMDAISKSLKRIAREFRTTVIGVSQLNRGLKDRRDKRPELHELKGAGALEEDADVVVFLHREDLFQRDRAKHDGSAEVIVAKGRNCGTGKMEMRFDGFATRFVDVAQEDLENDEPHWQD
jgi:replicative DNA helicase